jgi:hypothetical protein
MKLSVNDESRARSEVERLLAIAVDSKWLLDELSVFGTSRFRGARALSRSQWRRLISLASA